MPLLSAAGGLTTKGLTAAFGTSSAGGPTGTGPSKGPAQTPTAPASATEAKRLDDLKHRRIEIIRQHVAAEPSTMSPEERIESANDLYNKLLDADERRDPRQLYVQMVDIRENAAVDQQPTMNSASVALVSRLLDGAYLAGGLGPLGPLAIDGHDTLKRWGVWDAVVNGGKRLPWLNMKTWKLEYPAVSESDWNELQAWYAKHGYRQRSSVSLVPPTVEDYRRKKRAE